MCKGSFFYPFQFETVLMQNIIKNKRLAVTCAAFLLAYCFFQFFYPYHLIRREQLTLFLYDIDYILDTYSGSGWLARLTCDFLEQFFCLPAAGPVVIALLLVAIGNVSYSFFRCFSGKRLSLLLSSLLFIWSFLRETDSQFSTRYTIVMLAYLSLLLLVFSCRRDWKRLIPALLLIPLSVWAFGTPFHQYYGRVAGTPDYKIEKVMALDIEASRENWDKVLRLAEDDPKINEASYFYNLANAMEGRLGGKLLDYSQNHTRSLFLWVSDKSSPFINSIAGEVWYHLGDMTLAEQSMMVGLQASPKHSGAKFIKRLAQINLITGEYGAARKYLSMLEHTLKYHKWAVDMLPLTTSCCENEWLKDKRSKLSNTDIISDMADIRPILLGLLDACRDNSAALEYLLCYDLMNLDLVSFMEDLTPEMMETPLYQEAALSWLNLVNDNDLSGIDVASYGIDKKTVDRLYRFYKMPETYRNTYWYYYMSHTM